MKTVKITLTALAVILMVGCCPCRKSAGNNNAAFRGTQWQLVNFDGKSFSLSDDSYTVTFGEDGRVTGKGNCNRLNGSYEATAEKLLTIKGIAATRAFCLDQQTETAFISQLQSATSYTIDGRLLMLLSNGDVIMTFSEKQ